MTIIDNTTLRGASVTSSLAGNLSINEDSGEIVIRNGQTEVLRLNRDGFAYFDPNGTRRISMGQNENGMQQIIVDDAGGRASILIGQDPVDGSPVLLVGKEGVDVIDAS